MHVMKADFFMAMLRDIFIFILDKQILWHDHCFGAMA